MKHSRYFVLYCATFAGLLSLATCELTLIEAQKILRSVGELTVDYETQSNTKKLTLENKKLLTLGDAYSDSLITIAVPKEFKGADIPAVDWVLTIKDQDTEFAFKGVVMFESSTTKERHIGFGSGKQLKTGNYEKTDWTPSTLFEFNSAVTLSLRLEANGQSKTRNFPTIEIANSNEIYTWQDLQAMQHGLNRNDYTLMRDIDFPKPGSDGFPIQGFNPIGNEEHPFTGEVTGRNSTTENNYTISQLFIDRASKNSGLFGVIEGATIKHLAIEGASVKGNDSVGVLAGTTKGTTSISNVRVRGGNVEGTTKVGGLIGRLTCPRGRDLCPNFIERTSVQAIVVRGSSQVGGMIGTMEQGKIIDSYTSKATIKAEKQVGGFIGSLGEEGNVTLQNIYAANTVEYTNSGSNENGGLLIGESSFSSSDTGVTYEDSSNPQQPPFQTIAAYLCYGIGSSSGIEEASGDGSLKENNNPEIIRIFNLNNIRRRSQNGTPSYIYGDQTGGSNPQFDQAFEVFKGWNFDQIWQWEHNPDNKTCPTLR